MDTLRIVLQFLVPVFLLANLYVGIIHRRNGNKMQWFNFAAAGVCALSMILTYLGPWFLLGLLGGMALGYLIMWLYACAFRGGF